MKANLLLTGIIGLGAIATMCSCQQKAESATKDEPQAATATSEAKAETASFKIAYIEIDSLMNQYEFCKEFSITLTKKGENIRNTINQKGKALQNRAAQFQAAIEKNAYTREQAEKEQASLVKQQQDLNALQERLTREFDAEQAKFNAALRDSVHNFLTSYNKDKKYDYIISKSGDNVLLANSKYDITNDVVNGLNKRYKSTKK